MFKGTEPTKYIQLAYLTGILPIKKEKTQSALNKFDEFTMLSPGRLAQYIGFTEEEVQGLAKTYSLDFNKIKRWYDGYLLREYSVYNPRAVVSVMLSGEFKSYWSETASYEAIVPLINMNYNGLKTAIVEMLSGASVKVNTATFKNDIVNIKSKDDVLSLGLLLADGLAVFNNGHADVRVQISQHIQVQPRGIALYLDDVLTAAGRLFAAGVLDQRHAGSTVARNAQQIHQTNGSTCLDVVDDNTVLNLVNIQHISSPPSVLWGLQAPAGS